MVATNGKFDFDSGTEDGCLYIDLERFWYPDKVDFVIDLNGHTIDRNLSTPQTYGCVIWVEYGTLVITDSSAEGNGKITGGYSTNERNMDTYYTCGGGVHLEDEARLEMTGGNITGNRTQGGGAGLFAGIDTHVYLYGGSITNNRADSAGGGIYLSPNAHLYMNGDTTISGNFAGSGGGGIYGTCDYASTSPEDTGSEAEIYGGKIINNTTHGDGGGIFWNSYGYLAIAAEITGNSAPNGYGGGIDMRYYGKKIYLGGQAKIIGNTGFTGHPGNLNSNLYLHDTDKVITNLLQQGFDKGDYIDYLNYKPLEEGAQIGISMRYDYLSGEPACTNAESMLSEECKDYFTFDTYGHTLEWFEDSNGYHQFRVVEDFTSTMSNLVASIHEGDSTIRYYCDINRAWSEVVQSGRTAQDVKIKLLCDWYAPFGSYILPCGYNSTFTVDLNGYDIVGNPDFDIVKGPLLSFSAGNITIIDSVGGGKLTGANSADPGGAIRVSGNTNLCLDGIEISGNKAVIGGGVYWNSSGNLSVVDTKITNNSANNEDGGGGIMTTLIEDISNIYLGGSTVIKNNTAGGKTSNLNLYCLDEDDDWVDDEGRRINNAAGQVDGVPNRPLTGDATIGISICGFPGTTEDNTNEETLLISGDNNKFDYRDFARFFSDTGTYTVRAAFNPDTMEENPWDFYYNVWSHEEARYPKLTSVGVKSTELLRNATIDVDKQIITLTAKANKKKSFENMTLDYLISYGTNSDLTSVPGHDLVRNIFEDNGYLLLSNNNTYLTCSVNIVPEGGVWADEQDPAISPYAMSVIANGSTKNYISAEQGWAYALKQSLTYPVTIKLLADWVSPSGFYGLDEDGEEYGTYQGCLYLDDNYTNLTIDLNGYSIDRGLTSETEYGHVLYCNDGDVTLTIKDSAGGGKITGGYSDDDGGGIYMYRGALILEGGEISGNRTAGTGGGIYWESAQTLSLVGGKITGNTAGENGGGVYTTRSNNIYLGGQIYIKDNTSVNGVDNFYLPGSGYFINHAKGQVTGVPNNPLCDGAKIGIRLPNTTAIQSETTRIDGSDSRFDLGSFAYFEGDDTRYFVRAELELVRDSTDNYDEEYYHLYYNTWGHEKADFPKVTSISVKSTAGPISEAILDKDLQIVTLKAKSDDRSLFKSISIDDLLTFQLSKNDVYWRFCDIKYDLTEPVAYKIVSKTTGTYLQCKVIVEFPECTEHVDDNGDYICDNCDASLITEFEIESFDAQTSTATVLIPTAGTYTVVFADYEGTALESFEFATVTALTDNSAVTVSITKGITLSANDKVMLWSDTIKCMPICEPYVVK